MDGLLFLEELRRADSVPVIIVSARESDEDKILGLGLGADDFVTKPFSPRVLAARARAQLRRSGLEATKKPRIRFGPYSLEPKPDFGKRRVSLSLSPREFEVLAFLAGTRGGLPARGAYRAVWGAVYGDFDRGGPYTSLRRNRRRPRTPAG
jgi:DNA-binding response OmpR family regulator